MDLHTDMRLPVPGGAAANRGENFERVGKKDKHVSRLAREAFSRYEVFSDPSGKVVYIVRKHADIQDPGVQKEIQKVRDSQGEQNLEGAREEFIEELKGRYVNATRGMLINDDGILMKPYMEKGEQNFYDTGLTENDLMALLVQSIRVDTAASEIIRIIGRSGNTQSVVSVKDGHDVHLLHVGEYITKGGAGAIYKTWDIGNREISILKDSIVVTPESIAEFTTPTDVEAAAINQINPGGLCPGLQKPPYLIFRIQGESADNQKAGFFTFRYDGDLSGILANKGNEQNHVDFTTMEIIKAAHQLFAGASALNDKEWADLDIKPANVFIKKEDESYVMDISDFDGARKLTDEYFASKEFADNPVPHSSSDSIPQKNFKWLEATGKAIVKKHARINELRQQRKLSQTEKKELRALQDDVKLLQEEYRDLVKLTHAWSVGHILMQLLIGEVKLDSNYSDATYQKILAAIKADVALTHIEKIARLELANIMNLAMSDLGNPPTKPKKSGKGVESNLTAESEFPFVEKSLHELWEMTNDVLIIYQKADREKDRAKT